MRQKSDRPWEKLGMSRATWYRHYKPTKARKKITIHDTAKHFGATSTRSFQRMMRVLSSELAGYVHAGHFSIAQADRILSSPEHLRRFRELVAESKAPGAEAKAPDQK